MDGEHKYDHSRAHPASGLRVIQDSRWHSGLGYNTATLSRKSGHSK